MNSAIVVRKNTLVFTARYATDEALTREGKRQLQKGFRQFLKRLGQPPEKADISEGEKGE